MLRIEFSTTYSSSQNVAHQLGRGESDEELSKRSLWFFRHLIESHVRFNPGTEPTLSDDNRLFIRDEMLRLRAISLR